MDKDYVNRKIEKCEKLILAASSEAQKEIYQGYLDYWNNFLEVQNLNPDPDPIIDFGEDETDEIGTYEETQYANIFEIENAPKQAYYSRGGETHKTKAFKEFLNQKTQ